MAFKRIKNFQPDYKVAHQIYKRKIKNFLMPFSLCTFLLFVTLICSYFFTSKQIFRILSLFLTIMTLVFLVTCAWIFDFGTANKLRKQNFQTKGIKTVKTGQTYYYALKKTGVIRIICNMIPVLLCFVFGVLSFI